MIASNILISYDRDRFYVYPLSLTTFNESLFDYASSSGLRWKCVMGSIMITSAWHQLLVSILRWHVILYVLNIIRFLFKFKFAAAEIIERVIGLLETAADCTI